MKQCTACEKFLPDSRFGTRSWVRKDGSSKTISRSQCRDCISKRNLLRYHENPKTRQAHKTASYRYRIKSYGLTVEEYEKMLNAQDHKCYVCGNRPEMLVIDHCHTSGQVRKLLCNGCNAALGHVKEDVKILEGLISYVKDHS